MSGPPLPSNAATPERKRPHKLTQTRVLDAKYQLGEELGRGASGRVYRAFNRETGEFCAIKEIAIKDMPESGLRSAQSEIELLHTLQHERIVRCFETVRTSDHLYIVLELMGNGSLASVVKKFGRFPEPLVATYARQVLEGLEHLHAHGVCHRDIKGANVLIAREGEVKARRPRSRDPHPGPNRGPSADPHPSPNPSPTQVKLADLGVARKLGDTTGVSAVVGTPYWTNPNPNPNPNPSPNPNPNPDPDPNSNPDPNPDPNPNPLPNPGPCPSPEPNPDLNPNPLP